MGGVFPKQAEGAFGEGSRKRGRSRDGRGPREEVEPWGLGCQRDESGEGPLAAESEGLCAHLRSVPPGAGSGEKSGCSRKTDRGVTAGCDDLESHV